MGRKKINNYRTDLALENHESLEGDKFDGIKITIEDDNKNKIKTTLIEVENKKGEVILGKEKGKYITIESKYMSSSNKDIHDKIIKVGKKKLEDMIGKGKKKVLVVGLGNENVTPDSLGSKVISKILVTRHIIDTFDEELQNKISNVSGIAPGVMGQTGLDTVDVIKGIVEKLKPDLIIAIDALAGREVNRINNVIQITDTGITPGSGIGNKTKSINEETLGVKVIAIGVPTVIDAPTLVRDSINMIMNNIRKGRELLINNNEFESKDEDEQLEIIKEGMSERLKGLFVTPREIDQNIERIGNIVANIINISVHKGLSIEDINYFME